MRNTPIIVLILTVAVFAVMAPWAWGEEGLPQINPNLPLGGTGEDPSGIGGRVFAVYRFALLVAGLLAFGAIVYGAIKYTASGGNSSMQEDARAWITQAIWGIVLLLGATYLLGVINPDLTKLRQNPPAPAIVGNEDGVKGLLGSTSTVLYGCKDSQNALRCSRSSSCSDLGSVCRGGCAPQDSGVCGKGTGCKQGQTNPYYKIVNNKCLEVPACGTTASNAKKCE